MEGFDNLENKLSKSKNKPEPRRAKRWQILKEKEKDSFNSNNQSPQEKYQINSTLEKTTSNNHSIRKILNVEK